MDLIIRNARLSDRPNGTPPHDIGITNGKIVAIAPSITADADVYDAKGRLACPGLIETHIHLDKSRVIDRCAPQPRATYSPVKGVTPLKPSMTFEDNYQRAAATLEACIRHGATRMRTQVEVDPGIGMRGFDAIQQLAADYAWAIDVELCVFAQEGITNFPGTDELLVESLKRGAQLIGGAPRYDSDPNAQIDRVFELAREYDVDIDMHLDVGNTPDGLLVHRVRELTDKYKRGGRVTVGHMAKLSLMPPDDVKALGRQLSDSGIAVTVLPATDMFLMGRDKDHAVPRGVADANLLLDCGVTCSLSTNNVLNPATPFGDCSLIRMANMYANVVQLDRPHQIEACFDMLTTQSARILGLKDYGLAAGNPADVVVIDATSRKQAIAEVAQPVAAFKNGRQTMVWEPAKLMRP